MVQFQEPDGYHRSVCRNEAIDFDDGSSPLFAKKGLGEIFPIIARKIRAGFLLYGKGRFTSLTVATGMGDISRRRLLLNSRTNSFASTVAGLFKLDSATVAKMAEILK
jgi:hypothetical protein